MNKTLRITFTLLGVLAGAAVLVLLGMSFGRSGWNMSGSWPGITMPGVMNGMGRGMHGLGGLANFGWPGMILGWLVNLGLIVGVIFLVIWLVNRVSVPGQGSAISGQLSTPREILQTRYARGEITREQYLEMLGDLS